MRSLWPIVHYHRNYRLNCTTNIELTFLTFVFFPALNNTVPIWKECKRNDTTARDVPSSLRLLG